MRPKFTEAPGAALWASADYEDFAKLNRSRAAEREQLEGSLSSTIALLVVLTILFSLVITSLLTYCFHKWKLRGQRLQRAQEEYQKDQQKSTCQSTPTLVSQTD